MTSLNLDALRQATGVFITESDFQVIQLEYEEYLRKNHYEDNEYIAEGFMEAWKEEQEIFGTFGKTTDGAIKFYCPEGAGDMPVTSMEYLINQDMNSYHWENMCRRDWRVFEEILNTGKVDKKLLTNILEEETLTHEQIYQLQEAMKVRVNELLEQ